MSQARIVWQVAKILAAHPHLAGAYLRNRVRVAGMDRERRRADGRSRPPRGIAFRVTLACNLHCRMCYYAASGVTASDPRQSLPLDAWQSVVDEVAPFRPYITLTGGEPLLYPSLPALVHHIKKRGLLCTLITNGTLLARHAAALMENPPDIVAISLDGPRDIHDGVRGRPGTFERAAEGIRALQSLKEQQRRKAPLITVNCSITRYSYPHIDEMAGVAHELAADSLHYQFEWSLTPRMAAAHNRQFGQHHPFSLEERGGYDPPPVDPAEVVEKVRRARRQVAPANGRMFVLFHPDLEDPEVHRWFADPHHWVRRRPPACAWFNTAVLPNGDVEPCPGFICGNVTRAPFLEIWNGAPMREHRRRLAEAGAFPICVRCCAFFRRD
ncbi:MAG: radical SAM protein [Armatimonadetes bacterium]|nr:radical SAM protein [Armatimonadota bacterium]